MKINKKNVIIPSLLTTISAALVGSIAGTVAWYQYNTRVSASYYGTSAGSATENLQLSLDGSNWKTELKATDIQTYLNDHGHNGSNLRPVTTGAQEKDKELNTLRKNPIYQHAKTETWGLADYKEDYITFPIYLRVQDVDGKQDTANATMLEKKVYLQNLFLDGKGTSKDITDALRFHLSGKEGKALISAKGQDTQVHGALDLLNDGQNDKSEGYEDLGDVLHVVDYGVNPDIIAGYVAEQSQLPSLLKINDYYKVISAEADEANNQIFQYVGGSWNAVSSIPEGSTPTVTEVNEIADRNALTPSEGDYAVVINATLDAENDRFYQFTGNNGENWDITEDEPAEGLLIAEVDEVDDLPDPAERDDIYFVENDNKLFQHNENTGAWEEYKIVAESYKLNDAAVIADDSDPDHISGGKVFGSTVASVKKAENLPADAEVGARIFVRDDGVMMEKGASGWFNLITSNDKYFQYDEASTSWNEVAAKPDDPALNDLGPVDEEIDLDALTPADGDYALVTYAAQDAENNVSTLKLTVTLYLEGWQKLNGSSSWNKDYIGTEYKVGMTFVCEAR